jgi:hypothetical protein
MPINKNKTTAIINKQNGVREREQDLRHNRAN